VFGFLIYILQNVTFVGVEIAVENFEGVEHTIYHTRVDEMRTEYTTNAVFHYI
jgi:hypothetical protein